jgi:hypothetical protein
MVREWLVRTVQQCHLRRKDVAICCMGILEDGRTFCTSYYCQALEAEVIIYQYHTSSIWLRSSTGFTYYHMLLGRRVASQWHSS